MTITVADLAGVVYSAGKLFNGLQTGRLDTEDFLRSGSTKGINSRSDLALLEDLRDTAQLVIGHGSRPIDAAFVRAVNSAISRSGALRPGTLRSGDSGIGVDTPLGRHTPPGVTEEQLQRLLDGALAAPDARESALSIFVELSRAQPFEDGNKRTALLVANGVLLGAASGQLLTVPVDDARVFNDLLARAYVRGEDEPVKNLLRAKGFTDLPGQR
ncbi:Fic family protein [Mycobacterium koreense]|uniref:Cell filamentation protein Fic n=1 Tax=Mycolicibacillus koreensis TaxID=1069220 RepID=A0A7I7SDK0_9MYCO|nr:Fic family protein [Mycolicibacillus koreensis]MCV7247661.1 Fic family protein [Mycolicibacillus koreensis]OSC30618.1 cell filamentation protein Fic [Mycolicibacillus koreensis]BBY54045.1 hypothetical protein MKOR_12960 [Mycolicibacillus koreensis]